MKIKCKNPSCGKKFEKNAKKQVYCSDTCRSTHWQKEHAAKTPKVPRVGFRAIKAFCDENKTNPAALLEWLKSNYAGLTIEPVSGRKIHFPTNAPEGAINVPLSALKDVHLLDPSNYIEEPVGVDVSKARKAAIIKKAEEVKKDLSEKKVPLPKEVKWSREIRMTDAQKKKLGL